MGGADGSMKGATLLHVTDEQKFQAMEVRILFLEKKAPNDKKDRVPLGELEPLFHNYFETETLQL